MDTIIHFLTNNLEQVLGFIILLLTFLVSNLGLKLGKVMPMLTMVKEYEGERKNMLNDGKLDNNEKARLYDLEHALLLEVKSILGGLWPNRSK